MMGALRHREHETHRGNGRAAPSAIASGSIPWASPSIGEEEIAAVERTMRRSRISMGGEVEAFEREAAAMVEREHAVAVCNGTAAIELAVRLVGAGPGDEVLVSALSHIATVNAIVMNGATPVFCDVDPQTLNIDAADAAERVTARTRAVMVADYCGMPSDYDALEALVAEHGLEMVLDGAQSLGARHRGRMTCSLGSIATTSFHTAKPLFCGEGGMVFTNDPRVAERARRLRMMGEIPGRKYVHDALSRNLRITDMAAALGRAQIARATEIFDERAFVADHYLQRLAEVPDVVTPEPLAHAAMAWFSMPVLIPGRDHASDALAARNIETRSLYPVPAYRQPIPEFLPFAAERRPAAEDASRRVLNLPLFLGLTEAEVDVVVDALADAIAAPRGL